MIGSIANRDGGHVPQTALSIDGTWETREWEIKLTKNGSLGIACNAIEGDAALEVISLAKDGAMAQFNSSNPDGAVLEGDLILKLNGITPTTDAMIAIPNGSIVTLAMQGKRAPAPREWEIQFPKNGQLGFDFEEIAGVWKVTEVHKNTALSRFNVSYPRSAVLKGDSVIKINGASPSNDVFEGIAEGATMTLLLRSTKEAPPAQETMP